MLALRFAIALIVLFLCGCSEDHARFTEADMAGVWVSGDGAELRFDARGHFWGVNLPANYIFMPPHDKVEPCSGWGTWRIVHEGSSELGDGELELVFRHGKQFPIPEGGTIYVTGNGPSRRIYLWDDSEPNYEFKKRDAAPPVNGEAKAHLNAAVLAGIWESDSGAQLRFEAQGQFWGVNLPMDIVRDLREKGKVGAGSGTWTIVYESARELGAPELELKFERSKDFDRRLDVALLAKGAGPSLRLYFGLPDEPELEFKKQNGPGVVGQVQEPKQ